MSTNFKQCKCWEEHFYWNHSETTRLHFGKAMDGDFSEHMIIPSKFVKNFKEELPETIQLKGPSGNIWHVRLLKIGGDVIMRSGWKQFVKAHHIKEDDYLVFKYDGNSGFNVLVFDEAGCEKESSYFAKNSMNKVNEPYQFQQEVTEDSLDILHESLPAEDCKCHFPRKSGDKRQQNAHFPATCKSPQVSLKIADKKVSGGSSHCKRQDQTSRPSKTAKHSKKYKIEFISTRRPVTEEERARALQRANALRPTKPSFIKVMQATHVYRKFFLNFPNSFAAAYVALTRQTILLRLPKGKKTWSATYIFYHYSHFYSGLHGGWQKFVQENHLEEGDACVFELTKATEELVMVVHIFRVVDEITPAIREA